MIWKQLLIRQFALAVTNCNEVRIMVRSRPEIGENLSNTNLSQVRVYIFQFLGIHDNAIFIPTYWTPRFSYKTQIYELPETFSFYGSQIILKYLVGNN